MSAPAPSWAAISALVPPQVAIWAPAPSSAVTLALNSAWGETSAPAPDWVVSLTPVLIWALFCLQPCLRLLICLQADFASSSCSGCYLSSGITFGRDFSFNSCLSGHLAWALTQATSSAPSWTTTSALAPLQAATLALAPSWDVTLALAPSQVVTSAPGPAWAPLQLLLGLRLHFQLLLWQALGAFTYVPIPEADNVMPCSDVICESGSRQKWVSHQSSNLLPVWWQMSESRSHQISEGFAKRWRDRHPQGPKG